MKKNIFKEIIIILLLTLAIILILGVLLYEYVPVNKIIPEQVAYTTPENVKSELQTDSNVDNTQVVVTYEVDSTDLNNYKKTQDYVAGKKNPFASLQTQNNNTVEGNTTTTGEATQQKQSETKTGTNTNTNTQNTSGYIPDKGTK